MNSVHVLSNGELVVPGGLLVKVGPLVDNRPVHNGFLGL